MISAISYRITGECLAKIYPAGTYNNINWESESPCTLGDDFRVYDCIDSEKAENLLIIAPGLRDVPTLRLIETKRYLIKIEKAGFESAIHPRFSNENNKYFYCERDKDSIVFQFVNYLGRSKLIFDLSGGRKEIPFEVIPEKMDYEEDYIALTEALAEQCAELLLDYTGVTSNVYSQTAENSKSLLEQFIFLRQFIFSQNIQGLFESIKRNPDRILISEDELKPFGMGKPSRKVFSRPFAYGKGWTTRTSSDGCKYYLPSEIAVTHKSNSLDTAANRFVKYAILRFDILCRELIVQLQGSATSRQIECLNEAEIIHQLLDEIIRDSFFEKIGVLDVMPQNNQILQKREGYSQIFAAYSMVDLALQLDWSGNDIVYEGESKDVALLYEYWLFFELNKIVHSINGCKRIFPEETPFICYDKDGLKLNLAEGHQSCQSYEIDWLDIKVNLYYNRTFPKRKYNADAFDGSYSRPFRPDYTLAIFPACYEGGRYNGEQSASKNGDIRYIHFDAKYRISDLTTLIGDLDDTEILETDRREDKISSIINTYQRGDLLKMHTYNDAIRRTAGSYILYPGSGTIERTRFEAFSIYDEILPGVGAFAIKPSIDKIGENKLKEFIVRIIESYRWQGSRLNRLKYYQEMVIKEPSSSEISIDPKQENKAIKKPESERCIIGYIRAEKKDDYYYSLEKNGLLEPGSEFIFYYYAIKGEFVYTHHKDIGKAKYFRFYKNNIAINEKYQIEPLTCSIVSSDLVSRSKLVRMLSEQGYDTKEENHGADFYYLLHVKVLSDLIDPLEVRIADINSINGNDSFSPHSPKIIFT